MTNIDTRDTSYEEYLKTHAKELENYISVFYSAKVPEPTPPTRSELSFWRLVGIEALLYSVAAIAASVVSAVRTGGLFFILEQALLTKFNIPAVFTNILSTVVLVASLLGFEGYLLAKGFSDGRTIQRTESSRWGIVFSFIVILSAGIFSGLGIVNISTLAEQVIYIILAFLTAVGAAIVTNAGGKNIGFTVKQYSEKRKMLLDAHQEDYDAWRKKAVSSFMSSRGNKSSLQTEQLNKQPVQPIVQNGQKLSKFEQAVQCVEKFVEQRRYIPTVREVLKFASEHGVEISIGTSASAINRYIVDNESKLSSSSLVTEERIAQAKAHFA